MRLSIVVPVYQGAAFLAEFHDRMSAAARAVSEQYELIYVNDGSTDASLAMLTEFHRRDPRVVVVDLSRNFGMHPAVRAGLAQATGELVFMIVSDLQETPEWLPLLHEEMQKTSADVVYTREKNRSGSFLYRMGGNVFYGFVRRFVCRRAVTNMLAARLMTRRFTDAVLSFKERHIAIDAMCLLAGFDSAVVNVERSPGRGSAFTLCKRMEVAFNYVASLTLWPLFVPLALVPVALVYKKLAGLLILFSLGIIGVYLAVLISEARARPLFTIRHIYRQ